MKKIYLIIIILGFGLLIGCSLGNTPTSRVEDKLSKYQMLDKDISLSYTNLTSDTEINQDIRNRYEELIKKQYRNLSYEVKEEEIDGENATVTVQIEVMDYKAVFDKYNKNDYDKEKYHELVLDALEDVKDKIAYTIDFSLTKNDNNNWQVNELTKEDREKLLGIN